MDKRLESAMNELQKLSRGDDLHAIRELVQCFDKALSEKNKTEMEKYSKEAFELEKVYIPQIPNNVSISEGFKCESMIMTVGFQKEPIILSILCMKPKNVILLHTEGSRPVASKVENDPDIRSMGLNITPLLITEYDAAENYRVVRDDVLPRVKGATVVDPTAGRKVMVASLALVAFYFRYPMVYLHTVEQNGVSFPFTERLRVIENPFEFFGDPELKLVEEQFNCYLYEAAHKTCEQIRQRVRDLATAHKAELLGKMIAIYQDWDAFLHSSVQRSQPSLSERLEKIMEEFKRLRCEECLPTNVEANLCFLRKLDETWQNKENIVDEFRIVDIFVSALRRGSEKQKKYDDAIARLYRCMEMCSSIKLKGLGIADTREPNYCAFCSKTGMTMDQLKCKYREQKQRELPSKNLGLDDQMALLDIVDEEIAKIYNSMKEKGEKTLMDIRNRSILAHGTNPVPEDRWPEFRDKVGVIIEKTIGMERFNELRSMATHGNLSISSQLRVSASL